MANANTEILNHAFVILSCHFRLNSTIWTLYSYVIAHCAVKL